MHERPANQAAGLMELARAQGPRLMAMVSHGDEQFELPLLWRLCSSLADYGYSVTVLDGTTAESDNNPGLDQCLEYGFCRESDSLDFPAWNVIPAGMGLQHLCTMPERKVQSLQLLGHLFPHEGVIIVYSKAELLVPLLSNTSLKPLLALAPVKASLLTSYLALKQLLLKGRLEPTIVNLVHDIRPQVAASAGNVAASLSDCARNFLGYEVNANNISAPPDDDRPCADIQHLALRMLENAMTIQITASHTAAPAKSSQPSWVQLMGCH
jgi:hypothetical protein